MQISIWEKESFYAPKDVIIVGSGLVGLWCAWHLKKNHPTLSVAIVDRGIIPTGASTRNAGFACFGSVTELVEDAARFGDDNMLQLVEMRYKGLQRIRKVFKEHSIDFDLCGGYELFAAQDAERKNQLAHETERLNKLLYNITGKKKTFKQADEKIAALGLHNTSHLIENKLEGYLHSGKLCQALLQAVQSMGVTVLNAIEISGFEKVNDNIVLYTNQLMHLKAGKVLVCTNAFARQLLPQLDIVPARGQVLVTSPIEGLPLKGTFHYDAGYYYFRNLGNRVLLGGARNKAFEEENTTELTITDTIQQELEHFLKTYILPGYTYQITDRWSGIMGMGNEKMPIVKEVSPNVYCAVRMSGMGVALAPVIGEQVSKLLSS
ncbi:FAD-binding oxidoreductase [Niastella caeni]|uniref:FAD-binding oxidoreductase n=1 Tax=Niastella caeni TaxID=2569763 RepID=A0A4S8HWQ9_9BACT|nr:FAD-dependent oxidoreductase [Niastella caeni]THU40070.1 FAD-binding oxidoreductase [Niastella caeni]